MALSTVWTTITGKIRLYIEYFLIALLISAGSLAITMYFHQQRLNDTIGGLQKQAGTDEANIKTLQTQNIAQQATIDQESNLRTLDHSTIQSLVDGLGDVYSRDNQMRSSLLKLEKNNAQARQFLHGIAVPDNVRCVLDHSPCPAAASSSDQDPSRGTAAQPHASASIAKAGTSK